MWTEAEEAASMTKAASRSRLEAERKNRAMRVKMCVAKRRATWEPVMGPEPMTKRGPGEDIVDVSWRVVRKIRRDIGRKLDKTHSLIRRQLVNC